MVHLDTSSELVHKFNPSSNEPQCSTVEAMVYTPGSKHLVFNKILVGLLEACRCDLLDH